MQHFWYQDWTRTYDLYDYKQNEIYFNKIFKDNYTFRKFLLAVKSIYVFDNIYCLREFNLKVTKIIVLTNNSNKFKYIILDNINIIALNM